MSIDWTKPLVVAGTDRVARVVSTNYADCTHRVSADWRGDGGGRFLWLPFDTSAVTNAPPTPKIGPEHIEALVEAIVEARLAAASAQASISHFERNPCSVRLAYHKALKPAAEHRAARLVEIRAYLEPLTAQGGFPASAKDEA